MNGKKAKMLRRDALNASIGWPKVDYDWKQKPLIKGGKSYYAVGCYLKKKCTRALYKVLKTVYMNAQRAGLNG
jgi:ribosomal protein L22